LPFDASRVEQAILHLPSSILGASLPDAFVSLCLGGEKRFSGGTPKTARETRAPPNFNTEG
jgi:hypothetical protein